MDFEGPANVLVLPNLAAAKYCIQIIGRIRGAEMTGPILEGMDKPVQLVARSDGVRHIVNMATICAADAIRQDSYWETLATANSINRIEFYYSRISPSSKYIVGLLGRQNAP